MEVNYIAENVEMPKFNREAVKGWLEQVALNHGKRVGVLTYVFCDDEYILATNRKYLGHV